MKLVKAPLRFVTNYGFELLRPHLTGTGWHVPRRPGCRPLEVPPRARADEPTRMHEELLEHELLLHEHEHEHEHELCVAA